MKLFNYVLPELVKVLIRKQGQKSICLTFEKTRQAEVVNFIKRIIIDEKPNIFQTGNSTSVDVRVYKDKKWIGKSITFSFKGIEPAKLEELIKSKL